MLNDSPLKSLKCIPDSYFLGSNAETDSLSPFKVVSFDEPEEENVRKVVEKYRNTLEFLAIEQASMIGDELLYRQDSDEEESSDELLDLDSEEGQSLCKNYLQCIERLFLIFKKEVSTQCRSYRK